MLHRAFNEAFIMLHGTLRQCNSDTASEYRMKQITISMAASVMHLTSNLHESGIFSEARTFWGGWVDWGGGWGGVSCPGLRKFCKKKNNVVCLAVNNSWIQIFISHAG